MSDPIIFNDYTLSDEYEEYKPKPFYKKKKYYITLLVVFLLLIAFWVSSKSAERLKIERKVDVIDSKFSSFQAKNYYTNEKDYFLQMLNRKNNKVEIISYILNNDNLDSLLNCIVSFSHYNSSILPACAEGIIRKGNEDFFSSFIAKFPYYTFTEDHVILATYFSCSFLPTVISRFQKNYYSNSSEMFAYGYYVAKGYSQDERILYSKYFPNIKDDLGFSISDYQRIYGLK